MASLDDINSTLKGITTQLSQVAGKVISLIIGSTPISGGTGNAVLTDNGGIVGESSFTALLQTSNYSALAPVLRGYIDGLILSNDTVTPNSVLDVAAGQCNDSTNTVIVIGTAFTKSTAGAWTAGSGANGMGNGLTIADSTWYHAFAIINNGAYDVYFDTSITAANAPTGTTAFRRIGSFLTNGSANITPFSQVGEEFLWVTPVEDITLQTISATRTLFALSVPPGLKVRSYVSPLAVYNSEGDAIIVSSPDVTPAGTLVSSGDMFAVSSSSTLSNGGTIYVRTNTAQQIALISEAGNVNGLLWTFGWLDPRGRDS